MTLGPVVFDGDVLAVDVTSFAQSSAKGSLEVRIRIGFSDVEESNHRPCRLLSARG
jgi:hypothetical protein